MQSISDSLGWALLFCPGDRPERFAKAGEAADIAVLDLEDGVAAARKDFAREAVTAHLSAHGADGYAVRINLPMTDRGRADAEAVGNAGVRLLLMPKTESVDELDVVANATRCELIATIETTRGLLAVEAIAAHPAVAAVSWGPYDLAADLGMRGVRDEAGALLSPLSYARSRMLIAAAAARKVALDTVTAELKDPAVIERDATEGALMGFRGKFAIHPAQVGPIRRAYRPTQAEVERSRRLLASIDGRGVFLFEGEMVDEPMIRRARAIVASATMIE
ncbi:citrate lyase subunit beta / citryl-CoA lyase [Rhizobiales bacterium GAS191]|nr:citrate lyase subunit beta / citryl-CoA lyase [Rhizobiales bacterium GAS191]